MKDFLCKCNNCNNVMIDENPKKDAKQIEVPPHVQNMIFWHPEKEEAFWACPTCLTDEYLKDL